MGIRVAKDLFLSGGAVMLLSVDDMGAVDSCIMLDAIRNGYVDRDRILLPPDKMHRKSNAKMGRSTKIFYRAQKQLHSMTKSAMIIQSTVGGSRCVLSMIASVSLIALHKSLSAQHALYG